MAEEATIDRLEIEVSGNADSAHRGIDRLVESLGRLEGAIDGPVGRLTALNGVISTLRSRLDGLDVSRLSELGRVKVSKAIATNIERIGSAVSALPEDSQARIAPLSALSGVGVAVTPKSVENLRALGGAIADLPSDTKARLESLSPLAGISYVSLGKALPSNLKGIAEAVRDIPGDAATTLKSVSDAIRGFRDLSDISITKAVNGLKKLPEALRAYEGLDVEAFASHMATLNAQLSPLARNVGDLAAAVRLLPPSMRTAAASARTLTSAERYLADQSVATGTRMQRLAEIGKRLKSLLTFARVVAGLRIVLGAVRSAVTEVSDYIEDMNLFQASMGEFAESATSYARSVQDAMGIDMGEWSRYQGVLMSIATGFGIASDRASVMSQNMNQLAYDIASFYNLDVDEAMRKVQSGFAGELEPMRRIGYDLSVARMEIERTNLGIEKSVSDMTQAEKAALRYRLMMTQLTQVHGDMARTIQSPSNQLRVLTAQFRMAARAVGNLFIPALNAILPYAIAAAKAIQILAQTIARFFGIDATFEVDYSSLDTSGISTGGVDDLADSLGDAGGAAGDAAEKVKELKNSVMGFDELNKLVDNTSASDSGAGGADAGVGGSALDDIPLDTYDFLAGLDDYLTRMTDELAQKMMELLPLVSAIAAGLAAWRIARALGADMQEALGWALLIGGAVYYVWQWLDAWNNGLSFDNLHGMLGGIAASVLGAYLALGRFAAGLVAFVEGVALAVVSMRDQILNGFSEANVEGALLGIVVAAAGMYAMFGPVAAGVVALIGGIGEAALAVADIFANGMNMDNLTGLVGGLAIAVGGLTLAFGPMAGAIGGAVAGIALLALGFMDFLRNGATEANTIAVAGGILLIGAAIASVVGWPALVVAAVVATVAAIAMNWEAVKEFFANLWEQIVTGVGEWWGGVAQWLWDNVGQPIMDFFAPMGQWFSDLWSGIVTGLQDWWGGVAQWTYDNVIKPMEDFWSPIVGWFADLWGSVSQTAEDIWYDIGVIIQGCWEVAQRCWEVASGWFDANVFQPVSRAWADWKDETSRRAEEAWGNVRSAWDAASGWFDANVASPVAERFSRAWDDLTRGARDAWDGIQRTFSTVADCFGGIFSDAWARVKSVFQWGGQIFDGVVNAILDSFRWIVNGLISGINWAVAQPFNGLNNVIGTLKGVDIMGFQPFSGLRYINVPQIPYLAEGGQLMSGQLFVARENGVPEMVGELGGKTTVANNGQIEEGIARAVARVLVPALASRGGSDGELRVEVPVYFDGREVTRRVWKGLLDGQRTGEFDLQAAFAG